MSGSGNGDSSVMASARLHLLSDKLNPFVAPMNVATNTDIDVVEEDDNKSVSKASLPLFSADTTTNHSTVEKTSAEGLLDNGGSDVNSLDPLRSSSSTSTPVPVNASSSLPSPNPERQAEGGLWAYLSSWCGCSQPPMTMD